MDDLSLDQLVKFGAFVRDAEFLAKEAQQLLDARAELTRWKNAKLAVAKSETLKHDAEVELETARAAATNLVRQAQQEAQQQLQVARAEASSLLDNAKRIREEADKAQALGRDQYERGSRLMREAQSVMREAKEIKEQYLVRAARLESALA